MHVQATDQKCMDYGVHMHTQTVNIILLSTVNAQQTALACSCTSVIYSYFDGVQDLQQICIRAAYQSIQRSLSDHSLPCSLWASKMVHKQEEKGCRGRRLLWLALLTGADQFSSVITWVQDNDITENCSFVFHCTIKETGIFSTIWKQRSAIDAAISAPNPPVIGASWLSCHSI